MTLKATEEVVRKMKLYKLTDKDGYTRRMQIGETLWGEGVTNRAIENGNTLCTAQVIHAYKSLLLAEMMNPIHADLGKDKLAWEAEGDVVAEDGLKIGVKSLTTLRRANLPEITTIQRVAFGILCSLEVYHEEKYVKWANDWLSGKDRSYTAAYARAAYAAADAAYARAAYAAYAAADARAAYAAYAAADAAYAAYAADAADAAYAADAADAARAAARDAYADADAAYAAANKIDFQALAEKATN